MKDLIRNVCMLLFSDKGIFYIWLIIYTIYNLISLKKYKLLLLFWILPPFVWLFIHYKFKKSIVMWYLLMIIFIYGAIFYNGSDIIYKKIESVEVTTSTKKQVITKNKFPEAIKDIKWVVFLQKTTEQFKIDNFQIINNVGKLKINYEGGEVIYHSFPIKEVSKIIVKHKLKE